MKDNSDSQFFYKILNGINSNIRIIDVEANPKAAWRIKRDVL